MKWLALMATLGSATLGLAGTVGTVPAYAHSSTREATTAPPVSRDSITLSPDSGPPGTTVTIHGFIPSMQKLSSKTLNTSVIGNLAFGGFASGLEYAAPATKWSRTNPGHFTVTFQVPKTAWLTPNGTHTLADGPYSVAINCFVAPSSVKGCVQSPGQAKATFTLTNVPSTPAPKPYLRLSPATVKPGDTVHVSGWAPLTEIIGVPFPYSITWSQNGQTSTNVSGSLTQSLTGQLSGSFQVPASNSSPGIAHVGLSYLFIPNDAAVALAPTAIHVLAPLTWQALSLPKTVANTSNASAIAKAGPRMAMPSQTPGSFLASDNGGRAWHAISVAAIDPIAQKLGYPTDWMASSSGPVVSSVLLDVHDPSSFFITVGAIKKQYGSAPPVFYTPYDSTNGGATWHAVPVPQGFTQGDFGGFFKSGKGVTAAWTKGSQTKFELTTNGGATWNLGAYTAPANGLSLQFGPFSDQYPGMGIGIPDPVLRHQGTRWVTSTTVSATVSQAPPSQLDALHGATLLINPMSAYQLELTQNAGKSWQYVRIPAVPGGPAQHLMMLQNGFLLAEGANHWYVLAPHNTRWKPVPEAILPNSFETIQQWGSTLWWYTTEPSGAGSAALDVHHVSESRL